MGKVGRWFKSMFSNPSVPKAPTSQQLYSGPGAWSGYQPGAATAGAEYDTHSRSALSNLGEISRTGWSATDQQANQQAQRQAAQGEQNQRASVQQQAQMRGQGGGGAMLAGSLAAQQGGANRAQDSATNLARQGADRRMQASGQAAQLGQGLSQLAGQRAGATDQFNQWAQGMQTAAAQQQFDNQMARSQAKQDQANAWWGRITGALG